MLRGWIVLNSSLGNSLIHNHLSFWDQIGIEPRLLELRYTRARMCLHLAASLAAVVVLTAGTAFAQAVAAPSSSVLLIAANDNRRAAGERSGNALRLRLVVESGRWQPEGSDGRTF